MSAEIIDLPMETTLDIPPERILRKATEAKLESVIVIGEAEDGSLYMASSDANAANILWQLEQAKMLLLRSAEAVQ